MKPIVNVKPDELKFGTYSLFAEKVKFIGDSIISERATVSGGVVYSNHAVRHTEVKFSGRLAEPLNFTRFVLFAEDLLKSQRRTELFYGGFRLRDCILTSYTAETEDGVSEVSLSFRIDGAENGS